MGILIGRTVCENCGERDNYKTHTVGFIDNIETEKERVCINCGELMDCWAYGHWQSDNNKTSDLTPDNIIMDRDNLDDFDRIMTKSELENEVKEEYDAMSDEEKYRRIRDGEPTFAEYCLSFMSIYDLDEILYNEHTHKYERVSDKTE